MLEDDGVKLKNGKGLDRTPLVEEDSPGPRPCEHCGRTCGDVEGGYASITLSHQRIDVCHPNGPGRPDCYRLITVYHHSIKNCSICSWKEEAHGEARNRQRRT